MKSPPGRRHPRLAEAGQQRPGEQERGADPLGELLVDRRSSETPSAQSRTLLSATQSTSTPSSLEQGELGLGVADPRHVA